MPGFHIPGYEPIAGPMGVIADGWRRLLEQLAATVTSQGASLSAIPGVNRWALADQPTLGASDEGYVAFVSDYGHLVRWTGTVWEFAPGDVGNGFLRAFPVAPQETGWQLCDGTATDYLTVGGASLTATAFTTPDLDATPAYLKSANAYTGTINAKGGSTATGSTGTGNTGTGNTGTGTTGNESAHTHTYSSTHPIETGGVGLVGDGGGAAVQVSVAGTTSAGSAHSHSVPALSVPSLSVPSLSIPALGVGTIEMANLAVPMYFRR